MEIRSVCTASIIVLLLSLSSFLKPSAGAAPSAQLLTWMCNNGTFYAPNSTYQSNARSLLASLAANASRSLFSAGAVGASPDTVWGLALCRGDDTNGTDCASSCLSLAPDVAFGSRCMGVKDVTVFYDRCTVRFSFRDFLASRDNGQVQTSASQDTVTRDGDARRFDALVVSFVGALSDWAAFNTTSRFATGIMVSDQGFPTTSNDVVHNINGLVQCTPDQAPAQCRECLQGLIDDMPAVFNGNVGGKVLAVWCYLRFKTSEFFDGTPMLKLVAPQLQPPPSTDFTPGIWNMYSLRLQKDTEYLNKYCFF
jgi:hypothetical protein